MIFYYYKIFGKPYLWMCVKITPEIIPMLEQKGLDLTTLKKQDSVSCFKEVDKFWVGEGGH